MRFRPAAIPVGWLIGCATLSLAPGPSPRWPGTVLLAYPGGEELVLEKDGRRLTVHPPGPRRAGHPTYQSLASDGDRIATSFVRTPYPHYREGIAIGSVSTGTWRTYDGNDFHYVWSVTFAPDSKAVACKIERDWSQPRQLVLMDLDSGRPRVLIDRFSGYGPVTWAPEGRRLAYTRILPPPQGSSDSPGDEVRILDLVTGADVRLADGELPSWSPSGDWIAYSHHGSYFKAHPDGSDTVEILKPRRVLPWFQTRGFADPAVWSPDSRILLLNSPVWDETARVHVYELDLETRILRRKTGKGPEALGWRR